MPIHLVVEIPGVMRTRAQVAAACWIASARRRMGRKMRKTQNVRYRRRCGFGRQPRAGFGTGPCHSFVRSDVEEDGFVFALQANVEPVPGEAISFELLRD